MRTQPDMTKLVKCSVYINENEFNSALILCSEFLEENPGHPYGILFLSIIAYLMGDTARALTLLERLHEEYPDNRETVDALAIILARAGNLGEGTYYAKLATTLETEEEIAQLIPPFFTNFAAALNSSSDYNRILSAAVAFEKGNYEDCVKICTNNIKVSNDNWQDFKLLGKALSRLAMYDDAITAFQTNISGTQGGDSETLIELGHCFNALDNPREALLAYRVALQKCNGQEQDASSLARILQGLNKLSRKIDILGTDEETQADLLSIVLDDVEEAVLMGGGEDLEGRKIRVAYLSDALYDCPKGHYIERALSHHDKSKFEIYCYEVNGKNDATTSRLKVLSDDWRELDEMDDLTAGYLISCDGIDIVVDCIGIDQNQKLNILAQKPAPVVLSWLNELDSTIIDAVDGKIKSSDMENGCFAFDADSLLLTHDHVLQEGEREDKPLVLTASCALENINIETIFAWADILKRTPEANLLFGGNGIEQRSVRNKITSMFLNFGLANRIYFQNSSDGNNEFSQLMTASSLHLLPFLPSDAVECATALAAGTPVIAFKLENDSSMPYAADLIEACNLENSLAETPTQYVDFACAMLEKYDTFNKAQQAEKINDLPAFQAKNISINLEKVYVDALTKKSLI
jgi:predicted O-linked N-acetylglucosamine transferase (SPINDLY family)